MQLLFVALHGFKKIVQPNNRTVCLILRIN